MRKAFDAALSQDFDYFFWINDDTRLLPGSLRLLVDTAIDLRRSGQATAIVGPGATLRPGSGDNELRWLAQGIEVESGCSFQGVAF